MQLALGEHALCFGAEGKVCNAGCCVRFVAGWKEGGMH